MKTLIQAAVVTLFAVSTAQAQQAVQWKVSDGGNGHWYQVVVSSRIGNSWTAALRLAETQGSHLATFDSTAEWNFAKARCTMPDAVGPVAGIMFIGGRLDATGWGWVDGTPWLLPTPWWNGVDCGGGTPSPQGDGQTLQTFCGGSAWDDRGPEGGGNLDKGLFEWSADCNSDGIVDYGQIREGHLADANSNNVPDRCECGAFPALPSCCLGDLNADRSVDGADLGTLLFAWGPAVPQSPADLDGDGQVGGADLGLLLFGWGACPVFTPPWATLVEAQPDPAVVTDAQLRAGIQATGLPWRVRDTATQVEMLLVPPGTFQMGCIMGSDQFGCYASDQPAHQVTLTNAFHLGRYEVTQAQWQATMGSNPSGFQGYPDSESRPVERVSWITIQDYLSATGMRLPTEAEWEYACRAGKQTPFYNGSTDDGTAGALAWYLANSNGQTRPFGGKAANAFGFHDMLGNVWECVNDWYSSYPANAQTDPMGPGSASLRVTRGGSWVNDSGDVNSSRRSNVSPGFTFDVVGFRVARNP
jgi:formylglycine-generating enzyme required for sulfatase activity